MELHLSGLLVGLLTGMLFFNYKKLDRSILTQLITAWVISIVNLILIYK